MVDVGGTENAGVSGVAEVVDLDRYPLHEPGGDRYVGLVARLRRELAQHGVCDLDGFVRPEALAAAIEQLRPVIDTAAHLQDRSHTVWFLPPDALPGVAPDHPSMTEVRTVNRTVCADQIVGTVVHTIYEWPPLRRFIAELVGVADLHLMVDPLARINVMSYRDGEGLGWHFDRAAFGTTLLLQRPVAGGEFRTRRGLRSGDRVDHDAIGRVLAGIDDQIEQRAADAGTLTVFAGRDILHGVLPARGHLDRVIAVYSYVERPGVMFTEDERLGFYGRA